jgi:hypothetical protein
MPNQGFVDAKKFAKLGNYVVDDGLTEDFVLRLVTDLGLSIYLLSHST